MLYQPFQAARGRQDVSKCSEERGKPYAVVLLSLVKVDPMPLLPLLDSILPKRNDFIWLTLGP